MEGVLQWLSGHLAKPQKLPRLLQEHNVRLACFTLSLTSFLFLLVGLSSPIIKSIIIIKVSAVNTVDPVSNAITELQFGIWGVCALSILNGVEAQEACYGPQLGYTVPTSILSLVGLSSKFENVAETTLLTILVLHLVPAALSTVALVLCLFRSYLITTIALVVAIITAVVSTVIFAANVALVVGIENNIDSLFPGVGFAVTFGNGLWMVLAAVIFAWVAVILLSAQRCCCCGVNRRPKPKEPRSGISEKDSMEVLV